MYIFDDLEVVFFFCDLNLIMEDSDGVIYVLKCDSSGYVLEIVFIVYEDYFDFFESLSDESDLEDIDLDDSSILKNCF